MLPSKNLAPFLKVEILLHPPLSRSDITYYYYLEYIPGQSGGVYIHTIHIQQRFISTNALYLHIEYRAGTPEYILVSTSKIALKWGESYQWRCLNETPKQKYPELFLYSTSGHV